MLWDKLWAVLPDLILSGIILYGFMSGKIRSEGEFKRVQEECARTIASEAKRAAEAITREEEQRQRVYALGTRLEQIVTEDIRLAQDREATNQLLARAALKEGP